MADAPRVTFTFGVLLFTTAPSILLSRRVAHPWHLLFQGCGFRFHSVQNDPKRFSPQPRFYGANFARVATIHRSTNSRNSFASLTISSASVCVATEAWS